MKLFDGFSNLEQSQRLGLRQTALAASGSIGGITDKSAP